MQHRAHQGMLRLSAAAAIGAGIAFVATVVYLAAVLPAAGFSFDMLDDRALLLPWVAEHERLYGGLWMLYFLTQALLLPVPAALAGALAADDAPGAGAARLLERVGSAAIVLAMVGLVVIFTSSPLIARAYVADDGGSPTILLLGDLFADVGKEIRLFSELLLGIWLGGTGAALLRVARVRAAPWALLGIGAYTLLVAALKIADPRSPLEDTLGLLLALGYVAIGVELLRRSGATIRPAGASAGAQASG